MGKVRTTGNSSGIRKSGGGTGGGRSGTFSYKVIQKSKARQQSVGARQPKQPPGGSSGERDSDSGRRKNPLSANATSSGPQQKIAQAGDTIPLLFCKQETIGGVKYGGTWTQPDLVKQAVFNGKPVLLFAISQGKVAATPSTEKAYIGSVALPFIPGSSTASLTQYYKSDAQMSAAKNVCPITSGKIFCDIETASYSQSFTHPKGWISRENPKQNSLYWTVQRITRGLGDTTNSVFIYNGAGLLAKEVATGTDRTANFWASFGFPIVPANTNFTYNGAYTSGSLTGGHPVGHLQGAGFAGGVSNDPNFFQSIFGTSEPCLFIYPEATINNQVNTSNPASTGELYGVEFLYCVSSVPDPASFPSSYDFTTFSDITFLELEGDVRDESSGGGMQKNTTRQLIIFYESGVDVVLYSQGLTSAGPSNKFVDLAMHLFALIKRANPANATISQPIDTSNLQALATFTQNIKAFFNGAIDQSVNVIDYITVMAPFFLLSFVSENGRYSLQPLLPLSGGNIDVTALTPTKTFTDVDIIPGSFSKVYFEQSQRRNFNVSVVLREASAQEVGGQKTRTVRFAGTDSDAPVEQFDMTNFCTNSEHADIFAKYELARRKHSTHSIAFGVPLLTTSLIPTQIIKLQLQRVSSTGDDRTETEWYQVTNVIHGSDGATNIIATHFPVNSSDISKISNDVVNTTFEIA